MTRRTDPPLRIALLLTMLGLALAQTCPAASAPDPGKQHQKQPTLLWKLYPLEQHPTALDKVTIRRALRLLDPTSADQQARDSGRSPGVVLLLVIAAFLLGISAFPEPAFPDREIAGFVVRWRTELLLAGGAALVIAVLLVLS
jgi:hypothetical protein